MLNRRQFVLNSATVAGTLAVGGTSLLEMACNSATALAETEKFEPIVINVINLACVISSGLPVCGTMEQTIQNDYATVIDLWTKYLAMVTPTSTAWEGLNAAFNTFTQNTAEVFTLATGLNAPEITAIVASAEVLLSTIEALFPVAPTGASSARSARFVNRVAPLPTQIVHGKQVVNASALQGWVSDYNLKLETAHKRYPQAKVTKVKFHSKLFWVK